MIDEVSEHKPDLMPEQASEHRVNPHKSPFRVGITRTKTICCVKLCSLQVRDGGTPENNEMLRLAISDPIR